MLFNTILILIESRTIRRLTTRQSVPKDVLVELSRNHNKDCMFCGHKEISEKLYGILYQFNEIIVHYFCIVSVLPTYNNILLIYLNTHYIIL